MLDADFLDRVYYHNTLRAWFIALATFAAIYLFLRVGRRMLIARLERLAARTRTQFDDALVDLLKATRDWAMLVAALVVAVDVALTLRRRPENALHLVAVFTLLLQAASWGNALIGFFVKRQIAKSAADGSSTTTITALGYAGRFVLGIVLLLLALSNLGIDITALVAGLGITGIAVALAVQNILSDLFGALSIVLDKPFVVGDAITIDTLSGTVEHIGLKTTRLRATGGEQLIVSNADLLRSRVRNFKRMYERRVELFFGIAYETPPEIVARIPEIVREVVSAQPRTRFERSHFKRFGESSLDFETIYWLTVPDYTVFMDTQQAVNLELMRRFSALGVGFAFPSRTVYVQDGRGREAPAAPVTP